MNIKQLIESRYSVRSFLDKDVGFEKVKSILDTANSAPSGGNIQPWKVYVLGNNSKNELVTQALNNYDTGVQEDIEYEIYPKPLAEEYKKRRSQCAADMYDALSIARDDIDTRLKQVRENFKFFGAPIGMIVTIDKSFAQNGWGHVGMFLQNLWLTAISEGLGVCLQESWSIYPKTVKKVIDCPDNEMIWCGIAMGYPNNEDPINNYRTSRDSIDTFASFID
ncbi:MAG: nitroreductase [Gammaproteobacteria bacterium]|jgi:nitroreductase|uniref:Nitroreductase n=1 Tax=SAR86 cluster bacterium TaxID=2030880 RepID=A0A520MJD9_9GAMM|nr:MAG: nitroreductase [Gammaproteobacteria bacterium TMED242]RZO21307.1 MAG: nitroreductase [SAR86 cluster bacterium]|tara:strand:+ start:2290 stop:2955 length:666 start_codon:yes stop_codon:yes gene_type:complete